MRDSKGRFIKGHSFWLGKEKPKGMAEKVSKSIKRLWEDSEYHKRMSEAHKGQHSSLKTEFKKGHISWSKGKKLPEYSEENNPAWKGDKASYAAIHIWLRSRLGKANKCVGLTCEGKDKRYEWASISRNAKRDITDYMPLCITCHRRYDSPLHVTRERGSPIKMG